MTRDQDRRSAARVVGANAVPGCDTGPAGRFVFVTGELADLWREIIGHSRPTPDPDTGGDNH